LRHRPQIAIKSFVRRKIHAVSYWQISVQQVINLLWDKALRSFARSGIMEIPLQQKKGLIA